MSASKGEEDKITSILQGENILHPKTSWSCDFYEVMQSKKGYNNILGAVGLATSKARLLACQDRSAATVTQCLLHGVVLRDECPLHIHFDAAKELISKAMMRLYRLLGCDKTTTLAHHPTGNATMKRLWQWIASCLRQRTKDQYEHWEKYVRLMEHICSTKEHSVLKCMDYQRKAYETHG